MRLDLGINILRSIILGDGYTVSGTLGGAGLHACYYQKCSDQLQIGVELESSLKMQESVGSIGYQVDLPKADLVFRGKFGRLTMFYNPKKTSNLSLKGREFSC